MKHTYYSHKDCPEPGSCQYCDGGLAYCTTCKGAEGQLPTECPGRPMSLSEMQFVYDGFKDFKGGQWVTLVQP